MKIAIIPAREGSKRIKKKNIKLFFLKPIISWTIHALKKSNFFDKIVVSSDSSQILKISKKYGADILLKRDKDLSDDKTITRLVIQDAITRLVNYHGIRPKYICCIYPCNPFLDIKALKAGFSLLKKYEKFQIFSITRYSHPIQRALKVLKGNVHFINKKTSLVNTQSLKDSYYDAGQFYWAKYKFWMSDFLSHKKSKGIIIPSWRSHDIDTYEDWKRAEIFFKVLKKNKTLVN